MSSSARIISAGITYFALGFGAGFIMGSIRVPFLVGIFARSPHQSKPSTPQAPHTPPENDTHAELSQMSRDTIRLISDT